MLFIKSLFSLGFKYKKLSQIFSTNCTIRLITNFIDIEPQNSDSLANRGVYVKYRDERTVEHKKFLFPDYFKGE